MYSEFELETNMNTNKILIAPQTIDCKEIKVQLYISKTLKLREKIMYFISVEPMTRIELVTSSLPRKRSTTELHRLNT